MRKNAHDGKGGTNIDVSELLGKFLTQKSDMNSFSELFRHCWDFFFVQLQFNWNAASMVRILQQIRTGNPRITPYFDRGWEARVSSRRQDVNCSGNIVDSSP